MLLFQFASRLPQFPSFIYTAVKYFVRLALKYPLRVRPRILNFLAGKKGSKTAMIHYAVVDEIIQPEGEVLKAYLQDQYLRKEKIMGKLANQL